MFGRKPAIGTIIADRYRVEDTLGEGGMGFVCRATDLKLDRGVAMKLVPTATIGEADAIRRAHNDAEANFQARGAGHPNIATIYDCGTDSDIGFHFITMELLKGEDLSALVMRRGALPPDEVFTLLLQAADGLSVGHAEGIVHRDVKPQNLFNAKLKNDQTVLKVLDFGIAAKKPSDDETADTLHILNLRAHTPAFAAPEQLSNKDQIPATDVFSLAATAYVLLTGVSRPFDFGYMLDFFSLRGVAIIPEQFNRTSSSFRMPSLFGVVPGLPHAVAEVLLRSLSLNPNERFADAGDFLIALREAVREVDITPEQVPGTESMIVLPGLPASQDEDEHDGEKADPEVKTTERKRQVFIGLALVGIAFIGVQVAILVQENTTIFPDPGGQPPIGPVAIGDTSSQPVAVDTAGSPEQAPATDTTAAGPPAVIEGDTPPETGAPPTTAEPAPRFPADVPVVPGPTPRRPSNVLTDIGGGGMTTSFQEPDPTGPPPSREEPDQGQTKRPTRQGTDLLGRGVRPEATVSTRDPRSLEGAENRGEFKLLPVREVAYTQGMRLVFNAARYLPRACPGRPYARVSIQGGWEMERPVQCRPDVWVPQIVSLILFKLCRHPGS